MFERMIEKFQFCPWTGRKIIKIEKTEIISSVFVSYKDEIITSTDQLFVMITDDDDIINYIFPQRNIVFVAPRTTFIPLWGSTRQDLNRLNYCPFCGNPKENWQRGQWERINGEWIFKEERDWITRKCQCWDEPLYLC